MKLLLDTHLLLWAAGEPTKLPTAARVLIEDEANALLFSAASLWEIAIKRGLGRPDFQVNPRRLRRGLLDNGYVELPVSSLHAVEVDTLPVLHKRSVRPDSDCAGEDGGHSAAHGRPDARGLWRAGPGHVREAVLQSLDTSPRLRDACCLGILPICVSRVRALWALRELDSGGMSGGRGEFRPGGCFGLPAIPAPFPCTRTEAAAIAPASRTGAAGRSTLMEEGSLCSWNFPPFS